MPPPKFRAGEIVGPYVLLSPLGPPPSADRRAHTFLALEQEGLREVALVAPEQPLAPSDREAFEAACAQAVRLRALELPRLVGGSILDGGQVLLASRWAPGVDLRALIHKRGLPAKLALTVIGRVTAALAALHERGLTHGDVHPGNIRITPEGMVLLTGWTPPPFSGPSARFDPSERIHRYAPPEWYSEQKVSPVGDCYSLGLLIYEVFTGHPPLPPSSAEETHLNQVRLNAALESGRRPNKRIPKEFSAVVRNLLQVEMRARWKTGGEVLEAMAAIVPDESPLIEQAPLPAKDLAGVFRSGARKLLRQARAHLADALPMESASCLRQVAATLPTGEREIQGQAAELVEEALWYTFRVSSSRRSGERERMEALSLTLGRAAAKLRAKEMAAIAQRRLGVYARRDGPLKDELLPPLDPDQRKARIKQLKQDLDMRPGALLPALELAVLTPGFHGTDASSLEELRVDLLGQHELFASALFHRTQALATMGADPLLLDSLRPLLEGALKKASELYGVAAPTVADPMGTGTSPGSMPGTSPGMRPPTSAGGRPATSPGMAAAAAPTVDPGVSRAALLGSFGGPASKPPRRPTQIMLVPGEPVSAEERAMIMEDARGFVAEGHAPAAIDIYHQLLENELLYPENPDSVVYQSLRNLTWMSVVPAESRRPKISVQAKLYEVVHAMNPPGLVEICERIFLERLPEDSRGRWIEEVLARNPWSVAANLVAMREARRTGRLEDEARFRVTVGQELIQLGAVAPALEYLRQAKQAAPGLSAVDGALQQAERELDRHKRANAEFVQIREQVDEGAPHEELKASLDQFLEWHPSYLPALNVAADLAETMGDAERAAYLHFRLANVALLIEKEELARSHLRRALAADPEADDPLLLLSLLSDPIEGGGKTADELRVALMIREGLSDIASARLQRKLNGTIEDVMTYERLANIAQQAGEDPGPHWVEQGALALRLGHPEVARECLEHALRYSKDRMAALVAIRKVPGIEVCFPPQHLEEVEKLLRD